jgi:hypothetical protein
MEDNDAAKAPSPKTKSHAVWLIYGAIFLSRILMLSDAMSLRTLQTIPARLGVSLIYSAIALVIGKGRPSGFVAVGIIWTATLLLLLL